METGGIENLQLAEPRDQAKSKSINKGKSYEDKLSTEFETNVRKDLLRSNSRNSCRQLRATRLLKKSKLLR